MLSVIKTLVRMYLNPVTLSTTKDSENDDPRSSTSVEGCDPFDISSTFLVQASSGANNNNIRHSSMWTHFRGAQVPLASFLAAQIRELSHSMI
jgi:hypothetical protein